MLSSLLIDFVCTAFPDNTAECNYHNTSLPDEEDDTINCTGNSENVNDNDFIEPARLQLYTDNAGKFIKAKSITIFTEIEN